jgi:hypothetical protein
MGGLEETVAKFTLNDAKTYDENVEAFRAELKALDAILGPALSQQLQKLAACSDKGEILDTLLNALAKPKGKS